MRRTPVRTKDDVLENARYFFGIGEGEPLVPTKVSSEAKALLARGRNFVSLRHRGRLLFLPSRFAGYLHNDFETHAHDAEKDGGVTDPVLSRIFCSQPGPSAALESSFLKLCNDLDVIPSHQLRDYWPEISMGSADANDWTAHEVSATVDAYLGMLRHEIATEPYRKTEIRRALLPKLKQRSEQSVEFKFCNISAVLSELGLFYVPGYKPRPKYQGLLRETVEHRLRDEPALRNRLERVAEDLPPNLDNQETPALSELLVEPPPSRSMQRRQPGPLSSSGPTSDLADRDARNRTLGKAGEDFIVSVERKELVRLGRPDLAQKVTSVAEENRGYDVLSYESNGNEKWVEVKTTNFAIDTAFYLTENELKTSSSHAERYHLYRIFEFRNKRKLFVLQGDLRKQLMLEPVQYRARVGEVNSLT